MYAIVEIKGKQYKVREQDTLFVPLYAEHAEGDTIELPRVLLLVNEETTIVGRPHVERASVQATVLGHVKADKIIVFKKKRRKRYRVRRGHRQRYTQLRVDTLKVLQEEDEQST